jgi:hypothetical protein
VDGHRPHPRILPAQRRELRAHAWPSKDATDPAPTLFGWPPAHLPSLDDRLRLDALLAALAQGSQSILYRRLVDRQTRTSISGRLGWTHRSYLPMIRHGR